MNIFLWFNVKVLVVEFVCQLNSTYAIWLAITVTPKKILVSISLGLLYNTFYRVFRLLYGRIFNIHNNNEEKKPHQTQLWQFFVFFSSVLYFFFWCASLLHIEIIKCFQFPFSPLSLFFFLSIASFRSFWSFSCHLSLTTFFSSPSFIYLCSSFAIFSRLFYSIFCIFFFFILLFSVTFISFFCSSHYFFFAIASAAVCFGLLL